MEGSAFDASKTLVMYVWFSPIVWFIPIDSFELWGYWLFDFKILLLFDAATEPSLRDNDVLRRKSFYEMVSSVNDYF